MKIKPIQSDNKVFKFLIEGTTPSFINSVRRASMQHVPTMAVEYVSIYDNDSVMFNEYVALRIALIPLTTIYKGYTPMDECEDIKSSKCSTILTLEALGPGTVYSKDLKPTDPEVKPVYSTIPIVKLNEGESLRLEARAVLGRGKDHAKFQPGLAYIRAKWLVDATDAPKSELDSLPKEYFSKTKSKITINDESDLDYTQFETDHIKLKPDNTTFYFTFESFGNMPAKKVVHEACKQIESQIDKHLELLSSI